MYSLDSAINSVIRVEAVEYFGTHDAIISCIEQVKVTSLFRKLSSSKFLVELGKEQSENHGKKLIRILK